MKIDKKNVSLRGNNSSNVDTDAFKYVYGNADTIYLTADIDKVVANGQYAVISGVDNVTTGVKNASIETVSAATVASDNKVTADTGNTNISYGVYTLYKDNGYVIAAVVVGDDAASTKNLVYVNSSKVELESYDKTADEWTWTRKVIDAKGKEIELTEKSDSLTYIGKDEMDQGYWYQVKYDAKGNVVDAAKASTKLSNGTEYIQYFDQIAGAVDAEDTVLLETGNRNDLLSLKGSTLFSGTVGARGVVVDDETNIVFIQTNDNKETTSIETGVKALENALKNLNEKSTAPKYDYQFSAIIENGIATTVVIYDNVKVGYTDNGNVGSGKLTDAAISKTSAGKLVATWTDDGTTYANKDARATFYQVIDGKSYEKDSKTITLASGVTSHKLTAAAEIKQTGDYYAVIEIIDNGKVVASATTTTVGFAF